MTAYRELTPVILVTGFLGSGKTTLLNQLLQDPSLHDAAVIVNEFGEVGLDHHLLEAIDQDTVLLASGCVCCSIRDDLKSAVLSLHERRWRVEIPAFQRLIIETTGLADPAPIIATFMHDPELRNRYRLTLVITTIDALNAVDQFKRYPESTKQAAIADRLVVTKCDLARPEQIAALCAQLTALNHTAEVVLSKAGAVDIQALLRGDFYSPAHRTAEVAQWINGAIDPAPLTSTIEHYHHTAHIHSFCVINEAALDWSAFGIWLTLLLHRHGENVLRVKGLLNVRGAESPVVINGVQHLVHPPVHLNAWPDHDRRSRIVFIVQHLTRAAIEESLRVFNQLYAG